ncbi:hypothetical protein GGX14DRAFT_586487 [Mycena pura]|uniref:Uncharacterized protein n=1 Tax=Mycena pura TaxID=153505 RepID=A0AAD6VQZ5_9AGAR|nr:hypothetical protein GGX14DRAFT_586487 [Mycena pura]
MNTLIKLLPQFRRRRRTPAANRPAKQPRSIVPDGVLDISKEASDRLQCLTFTVEFPAASPTASAFSESYSPASRSPSSSSPPSPRPGGAPELAGPGPLARRRNFTGRQLRLDRDRIPIPIPPMPTTPPPPPPQSSTAAGTWSQPWFTDVTTAAPIRRSRTCPLSSERESSPPLRFLLSDEMGGHAAETTPLEEDFAQAVPLCVAPRTLRCSTAPPTGEGGTDAMCIVKRGSRATVPESVRNYGSARTSDAVDDVYAAHRDIGGHSDGDGEEAGSIASFVTISLSSSATAARQEALGRCLDCGGEGAWRKTLSIADGYATPFFIFGPPRVSPVRETSRPSVVWRTQARGLRRASVQRSRSLPNLCIRVEASDS